MEKRANDKESNWWLKRRVLNWALCKLVPHWSGYVLGPNKPDLSRVYDLVPPPDTQAYVDMVTSEPEHTMNPSPEAIAAAKEIEADYQFGRMEPQRVWDRAAIIDRHFVALRADRDRLAAEIEHYYDVGLLVRADDVPAFKMQAPGVTDEEIAVRRAQLGR